MTQPAQLQTLLERGEFVVTAEVSPGLTADSAAFLASVEVLRGRVDAVNVTDGAGARVAMSSLAGSALLARAGIEPVMQTTCRDRNRIAIAADLIGAAALGIRNILVLRGDDPSGGDEPEAKPVYDLQSQDVIAMARRMRDEGKTASGRDLDVRPAFHIGAADVPFAAPPDWQPDALLAKIAAGAGFLQTQFCFEPPVAERYLQRLGDFGILDQLPIIIGIGPIASARSARWMTDNLFGVTIPDALVARLDSARDQPAEGQKICVELIEIYKNMPGVSGVHIMAPAQGSQRIAAIVDAALPERARHRTAIAD